MAFCCYILYSELIDHFYIGSTNDFEERLSWHNSAHYGRKAYTAKASDWKPYLVIPCESIIAAQKLERFIKKRKSRRFIESIKKYPELLKKIINKLD
ncbi:MAG TPA: GIY-YIG nuclease family protein [Bacteroidales bacterium]|nr:GIY-YIG nuclease family protein [Bacteroidales bacterium]